MKIMFKPALRMNEGVHALSDTVWRYGEIKEIDEAAKIRVSIDRLGNYEYVSLCDDLLANPSFVLADTGKNPQYTCHDCDIETTADGFADPVNRETRLFEDFEGHRLCPDCYRKATTA